MASTLLRRKRRTTGIARSADPATGFKRGLTRGGGSFDSAALQRPGEEMTVAPRVPIFGALERTDPGGVSKPMQNQIGEENRLGFEVNRGIDMGGGQYAMGLRKPGPEVAARPEPTVENRITARDNLLAGIKKMHSDIGGQTNRMRTAFNRPLDPEAGGDKLRHGFMSPRLKQDIAERRGETLQRDLGEQQFVTGPVGVATQNRLGVETTANQDLAARRLEVGGRSDVAGTLSASNERISAGEVEGRSDVAAREFPDRPTEIQSQLLPGGGSAVAGPPGTTVVPPTTANRLNMQAVVDIQRDADGKEIGRQTRYVPVGGEGTDRLGLGMSPEEEQILADRQEIAKGDTRYGLFNARSRRNRIAANKKTLAESGTMSRAQFIAAAEEQYGRKPTAEEIAAARGKYWK